MKTSGIAATVIAIIILLGAGAYFVFWDKPQPAAAPVTGPQQSPAMNWQFKDAGTDPATQAPMTTVSIKNADGSVRAVGTYQGSCAEINGTSWKLLQGESSGVICWFAGGGTEIGVFQDGYGRTIIRQGSLDEGNDETPGTRGTDFKTLFSL